MQTLTNKTLNMKKNLFILMVASVTMLSLTGCQKIKKLIGKEDASPVADTTAVVNAEPEERVPEEPTYDKTDLTSFGLTGHVKTVVTKIYTAKPQGDKLVKLEMFHNDEKEPTAFTEAGVVTRDAFGNPYFYDAKGKFIKGRSKASVMKRNDKGQIIFYENRESSNHWEGYNYDIEYDSQGRMKEFTYTGWEEIFTYTLSYDGDNIYPSSQYMEGQATADLFKSEFTFRYLSFDEVGNWTEREVWKINHEGVEDGSDNPEMDTSHEYQIETREITYY